MSARNRHLFRDDPAVGFLDVVLAPYLNRPNVAWPENLQLDVGMAEHRKVFGPDWPNPSYSAQFCPLLGLTDGSVGHRGVPPEVDEFVENAVRLLVFLVAYFKFGRSTKIR